MHDELSVNNNESLSSGQTIGVEGMHAREAGFVSLVRDTLKQPNLLPVHRLDKLTSGLCLFAKNPSIAAKFGRLFESKSVTKYYLALVDKKPTKKQGTIVGDMEKARGGSWRLTSSKLNPAITQFFTFSVQPSIRLAVLKPHTGRTHQLRVALKALGSPILGDTRYANIKSAQHHDRMYLHAYQLAFKLDDKEYRFESRPTQGALFNITEFENSLSSLGPLDSLPWPKRP